MFSFRGLLQSFYSCIEVRGYFRCVAGFFNCYTKSSLYVMLRVLCPEHTEGFSRDEHTSSLFGITYFFTHSLFGTEELLIENWGTARQVQLFTLGYWLLAPIHFLTIKYCFVPFLEMQQDMPRLLFEMENLWQISHTSKLSRATCLSQKLLHSVEAILSFW